MPSAKQNEEFTSDIMVQWPLDRAIEWIKVRLNPADVFEQDVLRQWAKDNGFVEEQS